MVRTNASHQYTSDQNPMFHYLKIQSNTHINIVSNHLWYKTLKYCVFQYILSCNLIYGVDPGVDGFAKFAHE